MLDFGFYNMDCLEGMREFPDNYFDLAVCDPPYGIGYDTKAEKAGGTRYKNAAAAKKYYHGGNWDASGPNDDYFNELFRVSKNQIIWGGTTSNSYRLQRALYAGTKDAATKSGTILQTANSPGYRKGSEWRECIDSYGPV